MSALSWMFALSVVGALLFAASGYWIAKAGQTDRAEMLETARRELANALNQLEQRDGQIAEQDRKLQDLQRDLDQAHAQDADRNHAVQNELQQRQQQLQHLSEQLDQRRQSLDGEQQQLLRAKRQQDDLRAQLENRRREAEGLGQKLDERQQKLDSQHASLEDQRVQQTRLQQELEHERQCLTERFEQGKAKLDHDQRQRRIAREAVEREQKEIVAAKQALAQTRELLDREKNQQQDAAIAVAQAEAQIRTQKEQLLLQRRQIESDRTQLRADKEQLAAQKKAALQAVSEPTLRVIDLQKGLAAQLTALAMPATVAAPETTGLPRPVADTAEPAAQHINPVPIAIGETAADESDLRELATTLGGTDVITAVVTDGAGVPLETALGCDQVLSTAAAAVVELARSLNGVVPLGHINRIEISGDHDRAFHSLIVGNATGVQCVLSSLSKSDSLGALKSSRAFGRLQALTRGPRLAEQGT